MLRLISRLFRLLLLLSLLLVAADVYYVTHPLAQQSPVVDLEISHGSSMRDVSRQVAAHGIDVLPFALTWTARLTGHANRVRAGNYRIERGITPWGLIELFTAGSSAYVEVVFIEGWSFRRLRTALDAMPDLRHDTLGVPDADVLTKLGMNGLQPEGLFFPDTYYFARGTSDIEVLRRAQKQMQKMLQQAWDKRVPNLPFSTPYEGLILASMVEKETGRPQDRDKIASVFINRLRIGMPLQSDPTVIYGMAEDYDGNIRKRDLQTDNPYNTYTRKGLPPTPVAMPGMAALRATFNPAQTNYLYFVSRGDGTSYFSSTLDEHNRAVAKYQKSKR
ncbi:MAG TPA: endolytic transglycosylase MltG [Rhodocyclaceae bacterium]|nr:endolytic transglycosylase MltG [Rhodocyclaceae bacterium]